MKDSVASFLGGSKPKTTSRTSKGKSSVSNFLDSKEKKSKGDGKNTLEL